MTRKATKEITRKYVTKMGLSIYVTSSVYIESKRIRVNIKMKRHFQPYLVRQLKYLH